MPGAYGSTLCVLPWRLPAAIDATSPPVPGCKIPFPSLMVGGGGGGYQKMREDTIVHQVEDLTCAYEVRGRLGR